MGTPGGFPGKFKPRKTMSPENSSTPQTCPTCGTRLAENATRCLVCGRSFSPSTADKPATVQGARIPAVTISLPIAIGLVILLLAIGAGAVFGILSGTGRVVEPTPTPSPTITVTITVTPTLTLTPTLEPTATPLPPVEYTVKANDSCISIAYFYNVSVNSIITLNNLDTNCTTLSIGQKLLIPQPTATPSPMPSSTVSQAQATDSACQKYDYTVKDGDTLSSIAANFSVSVTSIKTYNSLVSDNVYTGQKLKIPLCERLPTAGPTPTATLPPPHPAPDLLQPADGFVFRGGSDVISLQWSANEPLRERESYAVTIEDVTSGSGNRQVIYTTANSSTVPAALRPIDNQPHNLRWSVVVVRSTGTTADGEPIWEPAGAVSIFRYFIWWPGGAP